MTDWLTCWVSDEKAGKYFCEPSCISFYINSTTKTTTNGVKWIEKKKKKKKKRKKRAEVHIELKFSVFLSRQPPRLGDLFITKLLKCSRGSDEERALRRTRREEKKEQRNQRKWDGGWFVFEIATKGMRERVSTLYYQEYLLLSSFVQVFVVCL